MLWGKFYSLRGIRLSPNANRQRHHPVLFTRSYGRNHPQQTLNSLISKFHSAVNAKSSEEVQHVYSTIRALLNSHPDLVRNPVRLFGERLPTAMNLLSKSGIKDEINTVFMMFADTTSIFGLRLQNDHHVAFLQAMLSRGWLDQARSRILGKPSDVREYHMVMRAFKDAKDYCAVLEIFKAAIKCGLHPNEDMYLLSLESTVSMGAEAPLYADILSDYLSSSTGRSHFSGQFWSALFPLLSQALSQNVEPSGSAQANIPQQRQSHNDDTSSFSPDVSHSTAAGGSHPLVLNLQRAMDKGGFSAGLDALRSHMDSGARVPELALQRLVSATTTTSQLKQIMSKLEHKPDVAAWVRIIRSSLAANGMSGGLAAYQEAKASCVAPTLDMCIPLLRRICDAPVRSCHEPRAQQALDIYQDLTSAPTFAKLTDSRSAEVYDMLLRMLASAVDHSSSFPIAVSLLKDMLHFEVQFEPSTGTALLVVLMRSSPSHDAAYELYSLFQEQYSGVTDQRGLEAVLATFSKLSFSHQKTTPPSLFFLMLNDSQRKGFKLSGHAYTTILGELATACTNATHEDRIAALASIRQIHKRLLLDPSLTPDTPLLNSLMNAYNRAGSPAEAMRIWELLFIQNNHNNGSLSIALDTLSHAGAVQQGASLMSKIHRSGFQLDRNNWQSWLELLCQADKIDDAIRLLCFDMRQSSPPITPDGEHVETLLKYAWKAGKRGEARARIKRAWPSLWGSLSLETP